MPFRKVAAVSQIPCDHGLRIVLGRHDLGLFHVAGRVFAIENPCPHAGYPLSEGELEGFLVICPAHGWEFDLRPGEDRDPTSARLTHYPVRVENEAVWVDLPESETTD